MTSDRIQAAKRIYERNRAIEDADDRSVFDFDAAENPHNGHREDQRDFSAWLCIAVAAMGILCIVASAGMQIWEGMHQ